MVKAFATYVAPDGTVYEKGSDIPDELVNEEVVIGTTPFGEDIKTKRVTNPAILKGEPEETEVPIPGPGGQTVTDVRRAEARERERREADARGKRRGEGSG